jgi:transportin-1
MHPTLVAPHLPEFAQAWCQALYEIRDNEEKDSAFRGLCTLVQTNPAGIAKVSALEFHGVGCQMLMTWLICIESAVVLQRHRPME